MTLILTLATNLGIVHVADSNLTYPDGTSGGTGQKVFRLGFVDGAISVAGAYGVGGESMDTWMPNIIARYQAAGGTSMEGLAEELRQQLDAGVKDGSIMHMCGYPAGSHIPEFHFVRNFRDINPATGDYENLAPFMVDEEFSGKYFDTPEKLKAFQAGNASGWFMNGLTEGRFLFHPLNERLISFFDEVWAESAKQGWEFRKPRSIQDEAALARAKFEVISALFQVSGYKSPPIGGPTQVEVIPAPWP